MKIMSNACSIARCMVMLWGVILASSVSASELMHNPEEKPNVVFVLTDDQRADAVGYHPNSLLGIRTPHIDRLADEGARFSNMFVTTSLCSPSRASFLSGTYTHTHGVYDNFTDYPHALKSFPLLLQQAGYQTAYIGKWHMGEADDSRRPGFDYWVTHKGQGKYYDTQFNINGRRSTVGGYYTDRVTDMALDWLTNPADESGLNNDSDSERGARQTDKPFALVIGHKAPHGPFVPEPRYSKLYDSVEYPYPASGFQLDNKPGWIKERLPTWHGIYGPLYGFRKSFPDRRPEAVGDFERFVRSYVATINSVDDSVGRVYAALERSGELDNTIFVFASDNGFLFGEHGMIDKRTMHEASIRVPLVVRYPPSIKAGTVVEEHVLSIDLAPSIMDLTLSADMPSAQGLSWARLLAGTSSSWRQSWLYEYNYEVQFPYTPNVRGIRKGDWKYVAYPHGDGGPLRHEEELYDMRADPAEDNNLAQLPQYRSKRQEMRLALSELLNSTGANPDRMPLDQGIKGELPEESIR